MLVFLLIEFSHEIIHTIMIGLLLSEHLLVASMTLDLDKATFLFMTLDVFLKGFEVTSFISYTLY